MKIKYSLLIAFCLTINFAQAQDLNLLWKQICLQNAGTNPDEKNALIYQNDMNPDGSWSDIAVKDSNDGISTKHLNRLSLMAEAHYISSSTLYNNTKLLEKIVLGLRYFQSKNPTSTNWWFNDIDYPKAYGSVLVLLKGKVPTAEYLKLSSYLRDLSNTVKSISGAENLVWVCQVTIYKGVAEDNDAMVSNAFSKCASTMDFVYNYKDSGLHVDYGFQMHEAQLYSGGYGLWIIGDLFSLLDYSYGTKYFKQFTPTFFANISNMLFEGHQRLTFRKTMDWGCVGRDITRLNGTKSIPTKTLDKMAIFDPANASRYMDFKTYVSTSGALYKNPGAKYFYKSDIMVMNGSNYYLSTKMISKRTTGTECTNGEGLLSYNLPLGATNIINDEAQIINIFPIWDWTRVPGTTGIMGAILPFLNGKTEKGNFNGTNDFCGGVTNASSGVSGFTGSYNGIDFKKAYFIDQNKMFCLGTDITSAKQGPIVTSVNQIYCNETVYANNGSISTISGASKAFNGNLKWVHTENMGYVFPNGGNITVKNDIQTGDWKLINRDSKSTTAPGNVFSIWLDHGSAPTKASYQYIVYPYVTYANFPAEIANLKFTSVANTSIVQAVRNDATGYHGAVFYTAGTVDFKDGIKISVDKPAIVLVTGQSPNLTISVSDPMYVSNQTIKLTINQSLTGANATKSGTNTIIACSMPSGNYLGKEFSGKYTQVVTGFETDLVENQIIQCFPNPFTESLQLTIQGNYALYTLSGNLIEKGTCQGNCEIGNALNSGMYILEVGSQRLKIVKQ